MCGNSQEVQIIRHVILSPSQLSVTSMSRQLFIILGIANGEKVIHTDSGMSMLKSVLTMKIFAVSLRFTEWHEIKGFTGAVPF